MSDTTAAHVLRVRAERIITANRYMTLSTCDESGPWAAPVAYVVDDERVFYWASRRDARHSRSIRLGRSASIAVFDSTAEHEQVDGIQASGDASEVGEERLDQMFELYVARYPMYVDLPREQLTPAGLFGLYQFVPTAVYLLDLEATDGDRRIAVELAAS